jgi:hypothetical protein
MRPPSSSCLRMRPREPGRPPTRIRQAVEARVIGLGSRAQAEAPAVARRHRFVAALAADAGTSSGAPPAAGASAARARTDREDRPRRGRARLSAASNSRSASRSCGRRVWRRKIESSCRSTRISNSFDPGDRQRSTTSSNRRRTTTYASDHTTRDLQRAGIADATRPTAQHRLDTGDRVFEPHGRFRFARGVAFESRAFFNKRSAAIAHAFDERNGGPDTHFLRNRET